MEKSTFDLNLLRFLVALDDERNVSRSALRIGVSQPSFSIALAKLREHFNDPLFVRTSRGMEPTPRTIALLPRARMVLSQVENDMLDGEAFEPSSTKDTFNLALSDVGEIVFLPPLLQRLSRLAPHANVRSVSLPPSQIEKGLEMGAIDLAIGYFPDLIHRNFFQQRLFTHYFVSLLRADHPLCARPLTLEAYTAAGHAVVRAEGRSQEILESFLIKHHIQRRIVLETPHFMSLPFILTRSDLLATVPHALGLAYIRAHTDITIMQPPLPLPKFDLKQHWHRKYHHDPRLNWLRDQVASLFNDSADEWQMDLPKRRTHVKK